MFTQEELVALGIEEDELTEEELILLLAALKTAFTDLETKVRSFYQQYGKDGVVTYAEARKWVDSKKRIRRLTFLNQTIAEVFESSFKDFENSFIRHLETIVGLEGDFFGVKLDIEKILNTPWGDEKLTWLQRLVRHKNKAVTSIATDMKISTLRQDSVLDVLERLGKYGESMDYKLKRLLRTESNAISSIARKDIYEALGVTKYRFLHLDGCSCEKCSAMHNIEFPFREYEVGVTANPLHSNCRDDTEPILE